MDHLYSNRTVLHPGHTKDTEKGKQSTKALLHQRDVLGTSGLYWKKHFSKKKRGEKKNQTKKIVKSLHEFKRKTLTNRL